MIKIEKDLRAIPSSLQVPPTGQAAQTTHRKRLEMIAQGEYKSNSSNDARYKMSDIKGPLFNIYHGKCAFCEQRVEQWQVEHFRPKSIYYWLAFSWDNLLYACPSCNVSKSNKFDIEGTRAKAPKSFKTINARSKSYDKKEKRLFFNPEVDDPAPHLTFQKDGLISSAHPQVKYTIATCEVDRSYLNDYRKKIWDDFLNDLKSEVLVAANRDEIKQNVMVLVRKFRRDAETAPANEFLAFRRYAIRFFLAEALAEVLT